MPISVEPKIKKKKKKVTPLGRLKKQGPKPGSFSYQQQQTLKPGYKVPPMMIGGEIRPFKDKDLQRKQRPMDRIRKRDRMKQKPKKTKNKPGIAFLTGGQAKIAAKAPPTNKIDGKDFAVLRAEKAKGRGMGLQDEKMKPGKIMKADKGGMGEATKYKKYLKGLKEVTDKSLAKNVAKKLNRTIGVFPVVQSKLSPGMKKRITNKLVRKGKNLLGKDDFLQRRINLGGRAGLLLKGATALAKGLKKLKPSKKMGGGMMMQRPMMANIGAIAGKEGKKRLMSARDKAEKRAIKRLANAPKGGNRDRAKDVVKGLGGYMGGGMMMRPNPVGMKAGKSVKVKCKIGRNKPTKMY
jgi:hypothetical protein